MPILPEQLSERYPERVGEFTGWYKVIVVCCDNPEEDANPSQRSMQSSYCNGARTIKAIEDWAAQKVRDHLARHTKMETTPCRPMIEETSAIYYSPDGRGEDVWVPLNLIKGALDMI